jgi:hypothetical protein
MKVVREKVICWWELGERSVLSQHWISAQQFLHQICDMGSEYEVTNTLQLFPEQLNLNSAKLLYAFNAHSEYLIVDKELQCHGGR